MPEITARVENSATVLQNLKEITGRLPGEVRKLEMTPEDLEIAERLDRGASDPDEGAINPENLSSKGMMTPEARRRWVRGDDKHNLQVFGMSLPDGAGGLKEEVYGFGYASQDDRPTDKQYDPGFKRRADFVRKKATLGNRDLFEYNFWADRADGHFPEDNTELRHQMTVGWVAQHILSLFEEHAQKQGDPASLAFFMAVEDEDFPIDGKVLKALGFKATQETRGRDYDYPAEKRGDNTLFVLTFGQFTHAMKNLNRQMEVGSAISGHAGMPRQQTL